MWLLRPARLRDVGLGVGAAAGDAAGVPVPAGWTVRAVHDAGWLVLTRGRVGAEEVATYHAGALTVITAAARYLGSTPAADVLWLDAGCPQQGSCRLHRTGRNGEPRYAVLPPRPDLRFVPAPAAIGPRGQIVTAALSTGLGTPAATLLLLLEPAPSGLVDVDPEPPRVVPIPGSAGARPGTGMAWTLGGSLVFAVGFGPRSSPVQPGVWTGDLNQPAEPFGGSQPADLRIVCACP